MGAFDIRAWWAKILGGGDEPGIIRRYEDISYSFFVFLDLRPFCLRVEVSTNWGRSLSPSPHIGVTRRHNILVKVPGPHFRDIPTQP